MKRDYKGRFANKGIVIPFPSISITIICMIVLFFLLPWIFVGVKLNIYSKIYLFLFSIFFNEQNCLCNEDPNTPNY